MDERHAQAHHMQNVPPDERAARYAPAQSLFTLELTLCGDAQCLLDDAKHEPSSAAYPAATPCCESDQGLA